MISAAIEEMEAELRKFEAAHAEKRVALDAEAAELRVRIEEIRVVSPTDIRPTYRVPRAPVSPATWEGERLWFANRREWWR